MVVYRACCIGGWSAYPLGLPVPRPADAREAESRQAGGGIRDEGAACADESAFYLQFAEQHP